MEEAILKAVYKSLMEAFGRPDSLEVQHTLAGVREAITFGCLVEPKSMARFNTQHTWAVVVRTLPDRRLSKEQAQALESRGFVKQSPTMWARKLAA